MVNAFVLRQLWSRVHISLTQTTQIPILAGMFFRMAAQCFFTFKRFRAQLTAVWFQLALDGVHFAQMGIQYGTFDEAVSALGALEWSFIGVRTTNVNLQGERTWIGGFALLRKRVIRFKKNFCDNFNHNFLHHT